MGLAHTDRFSSTLHDSPVEDGPVRFGIVLIDLDCVSTAGCVGCTLVAAAAAAI